MVDLNWPENHAIRRDGRSVNLATNQADLPLTAISSSIKGQLCEMRKVVDSRKNSISDSRVLSDFNQKRIARERKVFPPPAHFTAEPHASIRATQDIDAFLAFFLSFSFLILDLCQDIELI